MHITHEGTDIIGYYCMCIYFVLNMYYYIIILYGGSHASDILHVLMGGSVAKLIIYNIVLLFICHNKRSSSSSSSSSTRASPLSFRWPRPKHPVALSDVFVCPPTFALCNVFAFPGSYQWCCRSCQSLHLNESEMMLAHILEQSPVGICLLCVGLVLLLRNSQRILLLCCLFISCSRGSLHLPVHCWHQSGTAGGHFGEL